MAKFTVDWRFIEIEYELWALGQSLTQLEGLVAFFRDNATEQIFLSLKNTGWDQDDAEVQLANQEAAELEDVVVPRFVRGPFLVSLWACFEAGVIEVTNAHSKRARLPLGLGDIRGEGFLEKTRKFYEALVKLPFVDNESHYNTLLDIQRIRHALAHSNGQRRAMSSAAWRRVVDAAKRQDTLVNDYRGFVILTHAFLQRSYDVVNTSLRALISRARMK